MRKKTILSNISWMSLQDGLSQLVGMIFFIILGARLGEFGLGSYSYVFSVLAIANFGMDFGLGTYFWRLWSEKPARIQSDQGNFFLGKAISSAITLIPLSIYVIFFDYGLWSYFLIATAYFILDQFRQYPIIAFQSTNSYKNVFIISIFDRIIGFLAGILLLLVGYSLHIVLLALLLARIFSIFVGYFLLHVPIAPVMDFSQAWKLLRKNWSVFLIAVLSFLYLKIDVVILRRLLDITAVGEYSAAFKIIDTINLFPNLLMAALFPSLVFLASNSSPKEVLKIMNRVLKYLFILGLMIFSMLVTQASQIISLLYRTGFPSAPSVLRALSLVGMLVLISTPLVYQHLILRKDRELVSALIASTLTSVVGNTVFIPMYGLLAAPMVAVLTQVVLIFLLYRSTASRAHFQRIIMIFSAYVLSHEFVAVIGKFNIFALLCISFPIFVLLLFFMKVIKISDFVRIEE